MATAFRRQEPIPPSSPVYGGNLGYGPSPKLVERIKAADLVVEAIIHKPVRIATRLGIFGEILHAVAPKATQIILNTAFRMFPDSGAAQGKKKGGEAKDVELTPEQMAFAQITQGIHW